MAVQGVIAHVSRDALATVRRRAPRLPPEALLLVHLGPVADEVVVVVAPQLAEVTDLELAVDRVVVEFDRIAYDRIACATRLPGRLLVWLGTTRRTLIHQKG